MAADRRERQPGLVERGVGVGDRIDARQFVEADQPLPLRVDLVEFKREQSGQLVEPVEKIADDFVAGGVQSRQFARS